MDATAYFQNQALIRDVNQKALMKMTDLNSRQLLNTKKPTSLPPHGNSIMASSLTFANFTNNSNVGSEGNQFDHSYILETPAQQSLVQRNHVSSSSSYGSATATPAANPATSTTLLSQQASSSTQPSGILINTPALSPAITPALVPSVTKANLSHLVSVKKRNDDTDITINQIGMITTTS